MYIKTGSFRENVIRTNVIRTNVIRTNVIRTNVIRTNVIRTMSLKPKLNVSLSLELITLEDEGPML